MSLFRKKSLKVLYKSLSLSINQSTQTHPIILITWSLCHLMIDLARAHWHLHLVQSSFSGPWKKIFTRLIIILNKRHKDKIPVSKHSITHDTYHVLWVCWPIKPDGVFDCFRQSPVQRLRKDKWEQTSNNSGDSEHSHREDSARVPAPAEAL